MQKMSRDYISARTTYVMWSEERLWNVGVLLRVRLSSLVGIVFISGLFSIAEEYWMSHCGKATVGKLKQFNFVVKWKYKVALFLNQGTQSLDS
jgi:hypothetical protein